MIQNKQLVIDGQLASYTQAGEGADLLLLHGWGCSANIFRDVQTALAADFRVFALDFPGFGQSEEPLEIWGDREYADWTLKVIDKLNLRTPIVLGHSFGGKIAQLVADKKKLKKLVLTGSAGIILDSDLATRGKYAWMKGIKQGLQKILPAKAYHSVKEKMVDMVGSADYRNANPKMREIMKKVIADDTRNYAAKIGIPTLLVWGENDRDTPPEAGKIFNSLIPASRLVIFSDCGHYTFIDKKTEFIELISKFLKE
jgi:pimeloyl-ACP methyl ester carboxylesterase